MAVRLNYEFSMKLHGRKYENLIETLMNGYYYIIYMNEVH